LEKWQLVRGIVLFLCIVLQIAGTCADPIDPALQMAAPTLSPDDEKSARNVFQQLGSADFDVRDQAMIKLVNKGPAILPIAAEFAKSTDPEIASGAKTLNHRLLTQYDGYLPTDPKLTQAMQKKVAWTIGQEGVLVAIRKMAATLEIKLVFDPALAPHSIPGLEGWTSSMSFDDFLNTFGGALGFSAVPRGNLLLLTTPQTAQKLLRQRHTIDWADLNLSRDEAERVGQQLQGFFPNVTTEIHTGSEALLIRGSELTLPRAVRLVALLKPGAPDVIWPAPDSTDLDTASVDTLSNRLATPVNLALSSEDPLNTLTQLKKQKQDVFLLYIDEGATKTIQSGPWPGEAGGGSPLRLSLRELPLGLILRWVERRSKFPAGVDQRTGASFILGYEIGQGSRLQFRLQPKGAVLLESHIAGADVSFLYPRAAKPTAESDAAARTKLFDIIEPHRALFPAWRGPGELLVLRGRLLMQGAPATLARVLALVRQWRESGTPPAPPEYKTALNVKLDARLNWDGRSSTGGTILRDLRKLGNVDLLLEEAADGTPPDFEFTAQDAQLLPPGQHSLRALLDDLALKARARWRAELGVIVLTPRTDEKK